MIRVPYGSTRVIEHIRTESEVRHELSIRNREVRDAKLALVEFKLEQERRQARIDALKRDIARREEAIHVLEEKIRKAHRRLSWLLWQGLHRPGKVFRQRNSV